MTFSLSKILYKVHLIINPKFDILNLQDSIFDLVDFECVIFALTC